MSSNKLFVQSFRTNDLNDHSGSQIEFGKAWLDFLEIENTQSKATINLVFKSLNGAHEKLNNKDIELKLAEVTARGDRKTYANGSKSGHSALKEFFLYDLHLTSKNNAGDYFAFYKVSELNYFLYYIPKLLHDNFIRFFESISPKVTINRSNEIKSDILKSLQQIFYGAPGTGKSHEISKQTDGEAVVRTTFHPDSDYSTFVGAYKPVMRDVDVPVVPVVVNSGIGLKPAGTYTEKRITYQFVKQAFLKAYLGAWKKYADGCSICSAPAVREFDTGNGRYVINSVGVYDLTLSREFSFSKTLVAKEWPNLWINGEFKVPKEPQTGKSVQHAISNWIFGKINECTQDKFEEGWQLLVDTVKKNGHVAVQKTQTYIITKVSDDNETLTVIAEARNKKRATLRSKFYDSNEVKLSKLERTLVNILKRYNSDFDEAWELLKQNVNKGETPEFKDDSNGQIDPQYLIIEEINRGNCAQIFGDIFQLLDRGNNGFSVYPIEADSDLRDAIKEAFTDEEEFRLSSSLDIDDVIEYTSNYEATLSEDVENGRVLLLPPNLYIWATMNTSDQSLFPIDSAFKRRWDWVYMPIGYKNTNWTIEIGDKKYEWVKFQRIINDKIYGVDNSEDKQLGDYFVNADRTNNKISADTLLNKVLFYIWNDVCKDDPDQIFQWVNDKKQNESIKFSDFFGVDKNKKLQGFMAYHKVPAIGETDNTDNADNTNIQEETPAENDNEINS